MGRRGDWYGRENIARLPRGGRVLILADSKAAIAALERQVGREKPDPVTCGKMVNEVTERR